MAYVPVDIKLTLIFREGCFICTPYAKLMQDLKDDCPTVSFFYIKSAIEYLLKNYSYPYDPICKELEEYLTKLKTGELTKTDENEHNTNT